MRGISMGRRCERAQASCFTETPCRRRYVRTCARSIPARRAISETNRRRKLQQDYNAEHGINPQTIRKAVTDILEYLRPSTGAPLPEKERRRETEADRQRRKDLAELPGDELERLIRTLEEEMAEASQELRFEYAARLRDEIKDLRRELSQVR